MNKYEIENAIMDSIKGPVEKIIAESIDTINKNGFHFEKDSSQVGIWKDKERRVELYIGSLLSVSCDELSEQDRSSNDTKQVEIENEFYEAAEEGKDEKAHILASFEGEIANGGFEQLFLNKDDDFINSALDVLHKIGAEQKYRLSKEAIQVHRKYSQAITRYTEFQDILSTLEDRFESTMENIPVLYYEKYQV